MLIGVPKEIKTHEYRVGLTPSSVREFTLRGHEVVIEHGAGAGIGLNDTAYEAAGARIAARAEEIFAAAEILIKIKEPQPVEVPRLRRGQVLFTYLHLAADRALTAALMDSGATCIAYETVTAPSGRLPLLSPMSEVAGRMSIQVGAHFLEKHNGGSGVLLGGVPGVLPAKVAVIGGGMVGSNAARIALGVGARVVVLDRSLERLRVLDAEHSGRAQCVHATASAIEDHAIDADLVVGAVLVPGAAAPRLLSREAIARMRPGSVLVDVSIDQGGCFETSRPTTHAEPSYVSEGVTHYCVTNMPGGCARTATPALNNATLPFALALADAGAEAALEADPHLSNGLNIYQGRVTCRAVADALGFDYEPFR